MLDRLSHTGPNTSSLGTEPELVLPPAGSFDTGLRLGREGEVSAITGDIFVGNHRVARDPEFLGKLGIKAIISLDGSLKGVSPSEVGVNSIDSFNFIDGRGNDPALFLQAVQKLTDRLYQGGPVLVQCHAGRSRGPVVVAGYFVSRKGLTPKEALAAVAEKREICVTGSLTPILNRVPSLLV